MATAIDRDITATICSSLRSQLGNLFECEPAGERVQIRTPFLMPDGHQIDLYWRETHRGQVVSDLGDTYGWLFVNGAHDELTPEQGAAYDAACIAYRVERLGVALMARVAEGELADTVIRLGQAITMVSHTLDVGRHLTPALAERPTHFTLDFGSREPMPVAAEMAAPLAFSAARQSVSAAVEKPAILTANRIIDVIQKRSGLNWEYERNVMMEGQHSRGWEVDFMVYTPRRDAALIALYGRKHRGWQRKAIEHAFTVFSDLALTLSEHSTPVSPISVIDDNDVNWYSEPIELLADVSEVVWLSSPDSLAAAIAGGEGTRNVFV